ncbi:MAG: tetratricopeptide repeat protein [Alphaproteobacteria bacterium]
MQRLFTLALLLFLLVLPVYVQAGWPDASVDDPDPEKWLELRLKEAEQGFPRSQYEAAHVLHAYGKKDAAKLAEAVAWYRKGAENGEPLSQLALGGMYLNGEGMSPDYQEGLFWITLAHKTSLETLVQKELAVAERHLSAAEIAATKKRADEWRISPDNLKKLLALADLGTTVQCHLGDLYRYGNGVSLDYAEALKWYNIAAVRDNGMAQYQLYEMYFNGTGVTQNFEEAYFWLRISQRNNTHNKDPILSAHPIAKMLTFGQVGRVNARVETWKPLPPSSKP